jgi:dTMP kinase
MFITFEGGEGAGKTTLINQIEHYLTAADYVVVKTREPGGSALGDLIRQWLLNSNSRVKIGNKAELFLFLAGRAQHIDEVIRPALSEGKTVLCDRFNDSTIAYQGYARNFGMDIVENFCNFVSCEIHPLLTFYLDINPQIGLGRTKGISKDHAPSGTVDRIEGEQLEFHRRVRQGFLTIAAQNPERMAILNASQPQEAVFQQAIQVLEKRLKQFGKGSNV